MEETSGDLSFPSSSKSSWLLEAVKLPSLPDEVIRGKELYREFTAGKVKEEALNKADKAAIHAYTQYAFADIPTIPARLLEDEDVRVLKAGFNRAGPNSYRAALDGIIKEEARPKPDKEVLDGKLQTLKTRTKRPLEDAWQAKPMRPDDSEIKTWLVNASAYGVHAGRGQDHKILIFDLDKLKRCIELGVVDNLPESLVVAARDDAGHVYCKVTAADYEEIDKRKDAKGKITFYDPANGEQIGELKIKGSQCIAPGSCHWKGGRYTVTNDAPIAVLPLATVLSIIDRFGNRAEGNDTGGKETAAASSPASTAPITTAPRRKTGIDTIDITKIAMPEPIYKDTREADGEIQGVCPWHDSESKVNFNVNVIKNVWHCWRHQSGGGGLEALAVQRGFINCEDVHKGCLRGDLFLKVLAVARSEGLIRSFPYSPGGNAQRLILKHGWSMRFKHAGPSASGKNQSHWLIWNGSVLAPDMDGEAMRLGADIVQDLYFESAFAGDKEDKAKLFNFAIKSDNPGQIKAMLDMANFDISVKVTPEELDTNKWLMGLPGEAEATIDLRRQEVIPANMEDLITMMAGIVPAPKGSPPPKKWIAFLNRILRNNQKVISFLQRLCGYCLTGYRGEQVFAVLWGTGNNGKSTFLYVLRKLWGDYAMESDYQTFAKKSKESETRPDLMRLNPARIVTAVEAKKRLILNMTVINQATGGEKMVHRSLFENTVEEEPNYFLWLAVNLKPIIEERHKGAWRRVLFIPFTVDIPKEEVNKELKEQLVAEEGPQILRWCLDGLTEYQAIGLNTPEEVLQATKEYREENDSIALFAKAHLVEDPAAHRLGSKKLHVQYEGFCQDNGLIAQDLKMFKSELPMLFKNVYSKDFTQGAFWVNVRMKEDKDFEHEEFFQSICIFNLEKFYEEGIIYDKCIALNQGVLPQLCEMVL